MCHVYMGHVAVSEEEGSGIACQSYSVVSKMIAIQISVDFVDDLEMC